MKNKMYLLLVDDDPAHLSSLERMIRSEPELDHFSVLTATSGSEALDKARSRPIHVVISDFYMPGMDGIETLRSIIGIHPRAVPILISSGVDKEVLRRATSVLSLFGGYEEKPLSSDRLREMLIGIMPYLRQHVEMREDLRSAAITVAGVVHAIQPTVARTRFALETLQRFQSPRSAREDLLPFYEELHARLDELDSLISSLARFAGRPPMRRQFLSPVHLVTDAISEIKSEFDDLKVTTRFEKDVESLEIAGNAEDLKQALINLLRNGVEAGLKNTLSVEVHADGTECIITIKDSGPGFPGDPEALIPPFVSLKEGHAGLGLAEAYGIIRAHEGALVLRSQPDGGEVAVVLPCNPSKK